MVVDDFDDYCLFSVKFHSVLVFRAPADLQLPEQTYVTPTIAVITEPPEKKFKEKTMTSVDEPEASSVAFKKRKINNTAKRNTRQRLDDD